MKTTKSWTKIKQASHLVAVAGRSASRTRDACVHGYGSCRSEPSAAEPCPSDDSLTEITVSHHISCPNWADKNPYQGIHFSSLIFFRYGQGNRERRATITKQIKTTLGKKHLRWKKFWTDFLFVHLFASPPHWMNKISSGKQLIMCPDVRRDIQGSPTPTFPLQVGLSVHHSRPRGSCLSYTEIVYRGSPRLPSLGISTTHGYIFITG